MAVAGFVWGVLGATLLFTKRAHAAEKRAMRAEFLVAAMELVLQHEENVEAHNAKYNQRRGYRMPGHVTPLDRWAEIEKSA